MPIYTFKCPKGHIIDHLCKYEERPTAIICGLHNLPAPNIPAAPAFTPGRWGDTRGHYSSALGTYVENSMDRDRIMKEKGIVHADDVGGDTAIDSHFDRQRAKNQEHDDYLKTYDKIYSETNDPILSMQKAQEISPIPSKETT